MKILDRYIAKSFLTGYFIAFCVLIGLRVIIELFVNLDEFAEGLPDSGAWGVALHIATYYGYRVTLYFREIAGVITVVAAAFSLGKMVRSNELVAMIASGVSAKRIVGPILVLAVFFAGLTIVDQEVIIPAISDKLCQNPDEQEPTLSVWFLADDKGSLICSNRYDGAKLSLRQPTIITRRRLSTTDNIWEVTGRISAEMAQYDSNTGRWNLTNGFFYPPADANDIKPQPVAFYESPGLTPHDIPINQRAGLSSLLSFRQLSDLVARRTGLKDKRELISQKHFRITEVLINLTMLMVSLPVLICRDPRTMKSAVLTSFLLTAGCFVATFVCRMFSTEVEFTGRVMPQLWAWLPVFIFLPVAFIELDSMKT
jgi:lipopolysaccharide export system permease protein